jgi:hypothetical protein
MSGKRGRMVAPVLVFLVESCQDDQATECIEEEEIAVGAKR